MPRRFVNFIHRFDASSNSNSIKLYQPGAFPNSVSLPREGEVNGQIISLNARCYFPEDKEQINFEETTIYYSNKFLSISLVNNNKSIDIIEFVPWASSSWYLEELLPKFSPNLPFAMSQNSQINARIADIGEGLLEGNEYIEIFGTVAEEWDFNGGL